jgi:hypothetical protein
MGERNRNEKTAENMPVDGQSVVFLSWGLDSKCINYMLWGLGARTAERKMFESFGTLF